MKKTFLTLIMSVAAISVSFAASPLISYSGEVNVGFATGNKIRYENTATESALHRPFVETIHGVNIAKFAFIGAGLGVQGYFGAVDTAVPDVKWETVTMPLFVNVKGQLPLKSVTPYISASFGGTIIPYCGQNISTEILGVRAESKLTGGFYCDCGVGVKLIDKINIGVGMQHQQFGSKHIVKDGSYSEVERDDDYRHGTSFYVKVGFCW